MKKILTSISIIAICAMALDISMLDAQNQRFKNSLADSNLAVDMATASVQEARKIQAEGQQAVLAATETLKRSGECIEQLRAELRHSNVTAVNEKQGGHTFVYVEADSWVDLSNGEKVPAYKKIAPVVDIDPNPGQRWKTGPVTLFPTTSLTPARPFGVSNGSFIFEPQSSADYDIGTVIRPGTGGWNR